MSTKPRNRTSDTQVLQEYFSGLRAIEDLSEHHQERLTRIRAIHAALLKFSQAQAYRDINLCHFIFGDMRKANKEVKRHIAEQMALEIYRKAKKADDFKAMNAANRNYIEATGIKIEDPDIPDFEKLQPSVYPIIVDERLGAMLEQLLAVPGTVNLSKFYNQQAENAEYAELPERTDPEGD